MAKNNLKKELTSRHIFFIAIGSAIGTGLFYGSAEAIKLAGPSVLLAYLIGGVSIFIVMRALGEMILHNHSSNSFAEYASKYLHPIFGFVTGWMYVLEMVLVCLADVTAFSIYMKLWYPDVAPWIWSLGITLLIGLINIFSVKIFAEVEFSLTLLKIIAIFLMIIGGGLLLFGGFKDFQNSTISNLWINGGFLPNGISGFIASFSIVMFAFGGIEIIGLTAGETKNPDKDIPKAINSVPFRIIFFYILVIGVILCLFPWNKIGTEGSPFVIIFNNLNIKFAAHILNIVVIIAAVSAINSDVYGSVRMMYSLAKQKQGPKALTTLTANSIPIVSTAIMIFLLLTGVVLNYFYHDILFFIIAVMATFVTIWVWLIILCAELSMRRKLTREEQKKLKFGMPFWPITPILTIIFMLFVIGVLAYFEETRISLCIGILLVIILFACYWLFTRKDKKTDEISERKSIKIFENNKNNNE